MTRLDQVKQISAMYDNGDLDDEYAEYIMKHCHGERVICNGSTLLEAQEDGYLLEAFLESLVTV
jgi:hypothetical protein